MTDLRVALRKESVDRNFEKPAKCRLCVYVALRKESVDRNGNLNNTSNCRLAAHQKGSEDRAIPHNSRLAA